MRERRRAEIVYAQGFPSIADCGAGALVIDPETQAAEAP